MTTIRSSVDPALIEEQRTLGWPDMHPEDYCHKCGARNPLWCASREDWLTATAAWAAETGREGVCCVTCFAEMHQEATGMPLIWIITPWRSTWEQHADPAGPDPLADHPRADAPSQDGT